MIKSKDDLRKYLKEDKEKLGIKRKFPRPFYDEVWRFQIALRRAEYAVNCRRGILFLPYIIFRKMVFHWMSVKCGFTIPLNVFGPGLSIAHYGTIVVNDHARVGANCRIQEGVTIGASGGSDAPIIGNNVFIGSGAKILGKLEIADNIAIGAGAVVTRSCLEKNATLVGVPAKVVSYNGSERFIVSKKD